MTEKNRNIWRTITQILGLIGLVSLIFSGILFSIRLSWDKFVWIPLIIGGVLSVLYLVFNFRHILELFSTRKVKIGANVTIISIVGVLLWVMVGYMNSRHYHRFDLTENRQFNLSDKTKSILSELKDDITITTLFRSDTLLFRQVGDLLDGYISASKKIKVQFIDAERERSKVEELAKRVKMDTFQLNSVIFEYKGKYKQVNESDLQEFDYSRFLSYQRPKPPKFRGEEVFTSTILSLIQEKQTTLYFTTGHGEKSIDDYRNTGISNAAKHLKRDNFLLKTVMLLSSREVPDDCDVLIIVGLSKPFLPEEVSVLKQYLSKEGKLIVAIDPVVDSGFQDLLEEYNISLGNDVIIDPGATLFFAGPTTLFVQSYGYHEIVKKMKSLATVLSFARSVEELNMKDQKWEVSRLLESSLKGWGETNLKDKKAKFDKGIDKKGPVSLAVAVSAKKMSYAKGPENKTRLVVIGDSDFVSNALIGNPGNMDFFINCINWLAMKEKLISISPKTMDIRKITLSRIQAVSIFWATVVGLPFIALISGGIVWFRRRK